MLAGPVDDLGGRIVFAGGGPAPVPGVATAVDSGRTRVKLPPALQVLHHRDFRLYWGGQAISMTGTWMQVMAQGWVVTRLSTSASVLGALNVATTLPMLLLFTLGNSDLGYLVNFEFIAEEVVRTLVGSLGLVSAVPLATGIASLFALRAESLGRWEQVLGPEGAGEGHGHVH